jgi:hypothetical protein
MTQFRISKKVAAALLSVGVSAGGLMVPTGSRAQTANATAVSLTVKPTNEKRVGGCDVKLTIENLPPGKTAEFTSTCQPGETNCTPQTFKNLGAGTYCLKNGALNKSAGGGPPAGGPPGGGGPPNGGGGCIPKITPHVIPCQ